MGKSVNHNVLNKKRGFYYKLQFLSRSFDKEHNIKKNKKIPSFTKNILRFFIRIYGVFFGFFVLLFGKISRKENKNAKYQLAIVAIAKNESEYIREWVAFHKVIGISVIFLYDNDSDDNMKHEISDFIEEGFVVYRQIAGKKRQFDAYNDALKMYGNDCRYMAFIDCDEFLCPVTKDTKIIDVLNSAFKRNRSAGGIGINWCMYGSSGYDKKPEGLLIERFLYRANIERTTNEENSTIIKSVVIPKCVQYFHHPHYPEYTFGKCGYSLEGNPIYGPYNIIKEYGAIRLNHYFTKSREQWEKRRSLGTADFGCYRTMEQFYENDNNDIYDTTMLQYCDIVKKVMRQK